VLNSDTSTEVTPQLITGCPSCAASLPPGSLACGNCHALVHGRKLDALATEAKSREAQGDPAAARDLWGRSLNLLPPDSKQAAWVREKITSLQTFEQTPAEPRDAWARRLGPLGPAAILLAKFKGLFAAIFKLKFLLSLFSFVALYWALFGWKFGVGFAVSILIHELGHYIDIKRRGWPAEMPVFLPGLGAYVRWQALGVTLRQRAEVSLAGPLAGCIAAACCFLTYWKTADPLWAALGRTGAMLNAMNLIPIWVLDGGQAANALARSERIVLLAAVLALWLVTGEGIFFLVAAGVVWRLFTKDLPARPSWGILGYYLALLISLAVALRALPASIAHQ
jgi:Zn-dependent protease